MPRGECKLCTEEKQLVESHLIPRGVYDLCRALDSEPIVVTSKVMMQTSRQVKDYLLCKNCEQLLNREGETWLLPLLATIEKKFPFYDILKKVPPDISEPDVVYAASKNPEVAVDKLTHFALGVFWKASVHPWSGTEKEPRIGLGPYGEKIRTFLRGESSFPQHMALVVFVLPPPVKLISFHQPFEGERTICRTFCFYIPGIQFLLTVGKQIEEPMKQCCVYSHPLHPIIVTDISDAVGGMVRRTSATARISRKLVEYLKKGPHGSGRSSS